VDLNRWGFGVADGTENVPEAKRSFFSKKSIYIYSRTFYRVSMNGEDCEECRKRTTTVQNMTREQILRMISILIDEALSKEVEEE
jgi:hypothetical protein